MFCRLLVNDAEGEGIIKTANVLTHYRSSVIEDEEKHTMVSMSTIVSVIELYSVCVFM